MTNQTTARGLPADWLNGWLAAIGVLVLVEGTRLSWTTEPRPLAVFDHTTTDLAAAIVSSLPTRHEIDRLAIARTLPHHSERLDRGVPVEVYRARATVARSQGDFLFGACLTDLQLARNGELDHSPFDPPAPKGLTLWDRIVSCREKLDEDPTEQLAASLRGSARRVKANGLGFDHTRILSPADPVGDVWVDPAVEILVSVGMAIIHDRGDGEGARIRGWTGPGSRIGAFTWPVWDAPLGLGAVDALLDSWWSGSPTDRILCSYESVPYQPKAREDLTRGYASRMSRPRANRGA